jgi:hypothetical protein
VPCYHDRNDSYKPPGSPDEEFCKAFTTRCPCPKGYSSDGVNEKKAYCTKPKGDSCIPCNCHGKDVRLAIGCLLENDSCVNHSKVQKPKILPYVIDIGKEVKSL